MKHIGILMLILCNCITAFAQTGYWTDEGNYDTSWYQTSQKGFNISTPEQLAGLAWLLNNNKISSSNYTFNITGPISLEGHYWTPIKDFYHNLEGNNNVISGMKINIETSTKDSNTGFISNLYGNIMNLTLDNTCAITVKKQDYKSGIGGFAGHTSIDSHISNCHFKGNIVACGTGEESKCMTSVGGIFGTGYAEVEECSNSGTVTATFSGSKRYGNGDCCGGIAGTPYRTISHCTNNGSVTGSSITVSNFGGIAGYVIGNEKIVTVTDCNNSGNITTEYIGSESYSGISTGGIAGTSDYASIINNCYNSGNIKAINKSKAFLADAEAGGIVGSNYNLTINCFNTGNVSAISEESAEAGGIASTNYGRIINCYNLGEIYSSITESQEKNIVAGGIVGNSFQSGDYEKTFIINCYNAGKVSGSLSTGYIGGVAGQIYHSSSTNAKSQVRNCYASMDIINGIGNDEDNQEQYITKLNPEEMKKQDLANTLNNNLNAYNDTTTQIVQATLWEQNPSENSAYPYLQIPVITHEIDNYFSTIFKLDTGMPITASVMIKYWYKENETNEIQLKYGSPATIDIIPGIKYQYQPILDNGTVHTRQMTYSFIAPSIVENSYTTEVKRKSVKLEAVLKGVSDKIKKAEFVLFSEGNAKNKIYNATINGRKVNAEISGLELGQFYFARLKLTIPAGECYGEYVNFRTMGTGRFIVGTTQPQITQTTAQFEATVGINAIEPEGTLRECGTYYIHRDSLKALEDQSINESNGWKKAKGSLIGTDDSGQQRFKMSFSNLSQNSTYIMRPYVIVTMPDDGNVEEILSYPGQTESIQTLPVVLTLSPEIYITTTQARLSCSINPGDATVTEKGFLIDDRKIVVNDNNFVTTVTELNPNREYYYYAYAIMSDGSTAYSEKGSFRTSNISITARNKDITQTSALIEITSNIEAKHIESQGIEWYSNGENKIIESGAECRITELPANSTITYRAFITVYGMVYYNDWKEFKTLEIKTSFEAADAISNTSATLHATVECDTYSSAQFGFEWRKYDAPDLVPSNTVIAEQLIKGKIAFSLRGLSPSTYYKYRSFVKYKNKEYFSEWTAFGTADSFVLWAPKVETLPMIDIKGTDVTMYGYVIPGSEEVMQKGFEYWIKSQKDNILYATVKDDNMQAKVTGLQPFTTYCYRAFAKTASGTTYGQEFEFTTESGTGINSTQDNSFKVCLMNNPVSDEACIKINGLQGNRIIYKIYSVQGHLVKTGNTETQDSTDTIFIDTRELTGGLYILQISNDKQTQTLKMIVR